jgi:hypothetical protein
MDATLHIDEELFKKAQREATLNGKSVRQWVEDALSEHLTGRNGRAAVKDEERRRLFDALVSNSAGFRVGPRPSRDEMNER